MAVSKFCLVLAHGVHSGKHLPPFGIGLFGMRAAIYGLAQPEIADRVALVASGIFALYALADFSVRFVKNILYHHQNRDIIKLSSRFFICAHCC